MTVTSPTAFNPVDFLNRIFLLDYPRDAARKLATMPPHEAASAISDQPASVLAAVFEKLSHGVADAILPYLPIEQIVDLLSELDPATTTNLLSRLDENARNGYLAKLNKALQEELKTLLEYPEDTAGRLMRTRLIALNKNITANEAIAQIKNQKVRSLHQIFLIDDNMKLAGQIDFQRLAFAEGIQKIDSIAIPVKVFTEALDSKEVVVEKLKTHRVGALPVVDYEHRLVGSIEGQTIVDALQEDLATDMQTMVGVSKDERALSSSWFAVRKRLPWLQINLLTAFLAAAVVGAFEATIAKFTALAILLPIAAGQSGNTGAQALAVTMRGLTLREITTRHWLRVTIKETGAGLINGIATAITCGLGVYVWSQSFGLALIIALAMISSMIIAGISGALVPIGLKKIGQDPALSSSIILTTITDIAGFLSFLGIATALSGLLEAAS